MLIAISLLCAFFYLRFSRQQKHIARWKKSLALDEHLRAFQELYQGVNGFNLSRQARDKKDALDYIYGEIDMLPFIALLSLAQPKQNTVFYDLGSGTGKAVIACAMIYPIQKSIGIELLEELHLCACKQQQKLASMKSYAHLAPKINFIKEDFLTSNLLDATLIFINSSTLFGKTWEHLCILIDGLPQDVTVITTSKPLATKNFEPTIKTRIQMSWGVVPAYIHRPKTNLH